MSNNLCLFDLDDTLLPLDSDHAWCDFVIKIGWAEEVSFRRTSESFFAKYKAGKLDIHAYIAFATMPLRERTAEELRLAQQRFMREVIEPKILPSAMALVRDHQARGDLIALVTATNDFITQPIAEAFGIANLIAVRLERDTTGRITGRIHGTPSYRAGKVKRVEEWLRSLGSELSEFGRVSVYSDSINDRPLLDRANDPVATNPTPALETLARTKGWRILKLFE
jgi:HAD superfamily hydrolase (TIGR01490 family)